MTLEVRTLIPGLEDRGDDLGLTKAWQLLADADSRACRFAAMREPLKRALVHARRAGDRLEEAESLATGLEECWLGPLPVTEAIRRCDEILEGSRGDRRVEAMVWGPEASCKAMLGNFGRARALVNRRREIFQDLGLQYYSLGTSIELWEVEMLAGDPVAAERELRSTYDVLPPADETQARSMLASKGSRAPCMSRGASRGCVCRQEQERQRGCDGTDPLARSASKDPGETRRPRSGLGAREGGGTYRRVDRCPQRPRRRADGPG